MLNAQVNGLMVKAKLFRGLSDSSRLGILEALREGPRTVGEIVKETGLSQSNVSNHLGCLRECGLLAAEQHGRYVTYRFSDQRVAELLAVAEALLSDVAQGIYECTRYNLPPRTRRKNRQAVAPSGQRLSDENGVREENR